MGTWFHETIIAKNRIALFLCFAAFVVTFVVTRIITRNIRAGRGPFKDNVSTSGMHIHHVVPGIMLLVAGAFMSVATGAEQPWTEISAVLVGIGTSLVLDEFALILHLSDVYWSEQGRVSIELISLAVASMSLFLIGFSPNLFDGDAGIASDTFTLFGATFAATLHVALVVICIAKGKYELALLSTFIPFLGVICAIRTARPDSLWAKHFYNPRRMQRATEKAARFDARWGRYLDGFTDFIAGKPTDELAPKAQVPATGTG